MRKSPIPGKAQTRRIVVIGAGPCGIGAGWYLKGRGHRDWAVFEKNPYAGGLAASFRDEHGFTWDIGGHVFFSRRREFNRFLSEVAGGQMNRHIRKAWIHAAGAGIPYPLQSNIHFLPPPRYLRCLAGLRSRPATAVAPENFRDYLTARFGGYLARHYLIPLNRKMWSYPLGRLSSGWVGKRVSPASPRENESGAQSKIHNARWGANNVFFYPRRGGTGAVFRKAAGAFGTKIKFGHEAAEIDLKRKTVRFTNGQRTSFDAMIFSGDIRDLTRMLHPGDASLRRAARRLKSNRILVVGLGLRRPLREDRSWVYFPEKKYPFFRATYLSGYSPFTAPNGLSSLMLEVSLSQEGKADRSSLVSRSLDGLVHAGILEKSDCRRLASLFVCEQPCAYPLPTLNRDRDLAIITRFLAPYGIRTAGRFGAFRYEDGNMDDCFMQGLHAAREIMHR